MKPETIEELKKILGNSAEINDAAAQSAALNIARFVISKVLTSDNS